MKVGISERKTSSIVIIKVTTKVGDEHVFPAMEKAALETVVKKGENRVPVGTPTLALVNASLCALAIPFNIIRRIDVDGEPWFQAAT